MGFGKQLLGFAGRKLDFMVHDPSLRPDGPWAQHQVSAGEYKRAQAAFEPKREAFLGALAVTEPPICNTLPPRIN